LDGAKVEADDGDLLKSLVHFFLSCWADGDFRKSPKDSAGMKPIE
jgi:hypothetical protein